MAEDVPLDIGKIKDTADKVSWRVDDHYTLEYSPKTYLLRETINIKFQFY